jgi:hypothetical protein
MPPVPPDNYPHRKLAEAKLSGIVEVIETLVQQEVATAITNQRQTLPSHSAMPGSRAGERVDIDSDELARRLLKKLRILAQEEHFRLGRLR